MIIIKKYFVELKDKHTNKSVLKSKWFYNRKEMQSWVDNLGEIDNNNYELWLMSADHICIMENGCVVDEFFGETEFCRNLTMEV